LIYWVLFTPRCRAPRLWPLRLAAPRFAPLRLCVLCVLVSFAACVDEPPPARPRDTIIWHKLGEWSGNGNLQTETFTCDSGGLRLRWETRNETRPGAGRFRMSVHSSVSGRPLAVPVDHKGPGKDVAYFSDDPRIMYVVVESSDVDWTIGVDEAVPGTVTGPGR
jgi:hypothetical protein